MAEIVLSTLNAKYIHCAFGLRYLHANLEELQSRAAIMEFTIHQRPVEIAEKLLLENPKIIGLGVYIWNAIQTLELVKILKTVRPEVVVIIGGPEVSYEHDQQELVSLADYCITGEADFSFRDTCRTIIEGGSPPNKIIRSALPKCDEIRSPYAGYTEDDLRNRVIYVEASRGCPFSCEFCLSSLDIPVRQFELAPFLDEMDKLFRRGARQFKFVDRTFNLHLKTSQTILNFFLDRVDAGIFVHFEMVPDRLPDGLRDIIAKFPPGSLQFEVGIQSFNPEVNSLISRKQNFTKIEENIRYLRNNTGVHIHADLIAGLPGEDLASFAEGFDRLISYGPQEIQVGILKRLRGTPIVRHSDQWKMRYNPSPPYELLSNSLISFEDMQRISRLSRYWDLYANSGNFVTSLPLLWSERQSPFTEFMNFSDWLHARVGQRSGIALSKLRNFLIEYFADTRPQEAENIRSAIEFDAVRPLESFGSSQANPNPDIVFLQNLPERQAKHLKKAVG